MLVSNHCFDFRRRPHEERHSKYYNKRHKYYQGQILTTLTAFEDEIQK